MKYAGEAISDSFTAEYLAGIPRVPVETAIVVDYDRTLGRVDGEVAGKRTGAVAHLAAVAAGYGISEERIGRDRSRLEQDGGSFDPLSIVQEELSEEEFQAFCRDFRQEADPDELLYPDGKRLLDRLGAASDMPHLVMTYGVNPDWQRLKMTAAGYQGYAEIVDKPEKGPVIADWKTGKGTYDFLGLSDEDEPLVVYQAASVELVDDKPAAFTGLPEDCRGKLLRRLEEPSIPSQAGDLEPGIQVINSLDEINLPAAREPSVPGGLPVRTYRPLNS